MDLVIPQDLLQLVQDKLARESCSAPAYYRVNMTLGQILEGEFFTEYIKIGMRITRPVRIFFLDREAYTIATRQCLDAIRGQSGRGQRFFTSRW